MTTRAAPTVTASLTSAVVSGALHVQSGRMFFAASASIAWELVLEPRAEYLPYGGSFSDAFRGRPYVDGSLAYVSITFQGPQFSDKTYTHLVIDDYQLRGNNPVISGKCLSALFDISRQGFDDVESDEGAVVWADTALAEVLDSYGISHALGGTNWPVDHLHRIGSGRQIVESLLGPHRTWYFDNDTFKCEDYNKIGSATVDTIVDEIDLEDPIGFRRSSWSLYNRVTLQKKFPGNAAQESTEGTRALTAGKSGEGISGTIGTVNPPPVQEFDLAFPCIGATLYGSATRGSIEGVVWLDGAGNPINMTPSHQHLGSATKAEKVQFLYHIPTESLVTGEFTPAYEVKVEGRRGNTSPAMDLDPVNWTRTANDSTTQEGGLFVRPAGKPAVSTALARESDAAEFAAVLLDQGIVEAEILSARMELDPTRFRPGQWVLVTDAGLGCSARPFKVQSMELAWSEGSGSIDDPGDTGSMSVTLVSPMD